MLPAQSLQRTCQLNVSVYLRYTNECLREDTMTGRWRGSQIHMFIRAAKMFADDVRKEVESKSGWHPAGHLSQSLLSFIS